MIDLRNLTYSIGARDLLKQTSMQISDRDRICLAGRNGSGKTTLLRLIAGEIQLEQGEIIVPKNYRIGFLKQQMSVNPSDSPVDCALEAFSQARKAEKQWQEMTQRLSEDPQNIELMDKVDHLHEDLLRGDFYAAEGKARKILSGLGFPQSEQDRPMAELSGGWQMRAMLARLLLQQPECLLLDEPVNHLDVESMLWLQNYLKDYPGALILIAHDPEFVESVCKRLVEIESGNLTEYPLPFSRFREEKKLRREQIEREQTKKEEEAQRLQRFVDRFKAKATKASQARSKQKQLDKLKEEIEEVNLAPLPEDVSFRFPHTRPSGKWVFQAENLSKDYDQIPVFSGAEFEIRRGDKIAITGANGAGKTTLLRLLLGNEAPTKGEVRFGHEVRIGYFAQHDDLPPSDGERNLIDLLLGYNNQATPQQVRTLLGGLLFSADDAKKKYRVLSGGERARVRLCRLLLQDCNVLVLDEPTNHLDLESKERLMAALGDFPGVVLLVSHDRWFTGGVCDRVLWVKDGKVRDFPGDYRAWLDEVGKTTPGLSGETREKAQGTLPSTQTSSLSGHARKEKQKQLRTIQRKLDDLEKGLEIKEQKREQIQKQLCLPENFSDSEKCQSLSVEQKQLQSEIETGYQNWEELEKHKEEIEKDLS